MKLTDKEIYVWCRKAIDAGYDSIRLKAALEGYPRKTRKKIIKIFDILKGGDLEMPKKKKVEEEAEEEEFEDNDFDEEEVEEEEEEVEEETPKRKKRKVRDTNWQIQRIPETWRVLDPSTKEVVAEASSIEELRLQLSVMTAQHSIESARNTR